MIQLKFPKRWYAIAILIILLAVLLLVRTSSTTQSVSEADGITSLEDLDGKKIGLIAGSSYEETVKRTFANSDIEEYLAYSDLIRDLKNGRIQAYIVDEPQARMQIREAGGMQMLDELITQDEYAFVLSTDNTALKEDLDRVLADMRSEGILDDMANEWMNEGESVLLPESDAKQTLKVATNMDSAPFSYRLNGEITGYDISVIREAARRLGYRIEVTQYAFGSLLNSVNTGREDIAVGGLTCTEERSRSVLFTDSVYSGGAVAVVLDTEYVGDTVSFVGRIKQGIDLTFVQEGRWKQLLKGVCVTMCLSLASLVLGSLLGFAFSFALRSSRRWIRELSMGVNAVLGTLPLLIILMILYYIAFANTPLPAMIIGIIGLTLDFSNTVAGLLDAGIRSVDANQLEAAQAMGYRQSQVFLKVAFPQAVQHIYPQYVEAVSAMIKGTAIVGYITIQDLTNVSDTIRNITFQAFFPLVISAVIYFLIARLFISVLGCVMKYFNPYCRSRMIRGVIDR